MRTRLLLPALFIFSFIAARAAEPDNGFTAHEWGTFTSVQGSDGVQMYWNPQFSVDLPAFVYERRRVMLRNPGALGSKEMIVARQRMETPVIYFYSDRERTVDVSVKFPRGSITEWYPQESAANLSVSQFSIRPAATFPALHWEKVKIRGLSQSEPVLPKNEDRSHYYAARETDASFLEVSAGAKTVELEKFLFYRGVGDFETPLIVKPKDGASDTMSLENKGAEELHHLFLYEVRADGSIAWTPLTDLKPGETRAAATVGGSSSADALAAALRSALVQEGLVEKEAAAMVKTWETSWLRERGVRVLYTLPSAWTDRTLPLTITPAPKATVRVMVGRAEIITPAMEAALQVKLDRYIQAPPEQRAAIVAATRALGLGRFLTPALDQVVNRQKAEGERKDLGRKFFTAVAEAEKNAQEALRAETAAKAAERTASTGASTSAISRSEGAQ